MNHEKIAQDNLLIVMPNTYEQLFCVPMFYSMPFLFITFVPTVPPLIRLCFKNYFKSDESIITTALGGLYQLSL
ncbi:MAG: hypothetical protein MRQ09_04000 [Candidatus Midichloria sp.]|nr:hypothetical protein [Candidatus Midichloria sp.]